MEQIVTILLMLVLVVLSGAVLRFLPLPLPLPLIQIALGAILAAVTPLGVSLSPDVFFLLFLPPLLFYDSWRIPKEGLRRDRNAVLQMAVGLVFFTVIGLGYFTHWMIPAMPLGVAFALAAIMSPTDPVAVSAITERAPVPQRLLHILDGEALFNDASGLVCMHFAVAAVLTGHFSLAAASVTFVWLVVGGTVAGVGVTWLIITAKNWVSTRYGEETGSEILISILIPFAAYLVAEEAHASGILAVVAAGFMMSRAESHGSVLGVTRIRRGAVWDSIEFALSGLIFVLLGEQLPQIIAGAVAVARDIGHHEIIWLVVYVGAIYLALLVLRFVWIWLSLRILITRRNRKGRVVVRPDWRLVATASLAGVRGTVTLAGILTLPLYMNDASPFPARNMAIFLAAGVIILSLVVASVALPQLLRGLVLPARSARMPHEDRIRVRAADAAMRAIEVEQLRLSESGQVDASVAAAASARVMDSYRSRIETYAEVSPDHDNAHRKMLETEWLLWMSGLRAERRSLFEAMRAGRISHDMGSKLINEVDLAEARLSALQ